jgi:hypothetical protein
MYVAKYQYRYIAPHRGKASTDEPSVFSRTEQYDAAAAQQVSSPARPTLPALLPIKMDCCSRVFASPSPACISRHATLHFLQAMLYLTVPEQHILATQAHHGGSDRPSGRTRSTFLTPRTEPGPAAPAPAVPEDEEEARAQLAQLPAAETQDGWQLADLFDDETDDLMEVSTSVNRFNAVRTVRASRCSPPVLSLCCACIRTDCAF